MTEDHPYIGGTDVVLPDVDKALNGAIDGLDALLGAIKANIERGVPFPVAERLLAAYPVVLRARDTGTVIFQRLYSSLPTADETDYETPF